MAIKMMLITMEEDIITAETEVITQQFNMTEDDVFESHEKVQVGSVKCHLFLN